MVNKNEYWNLTSCNELIRFCVKSLVKIIRSHCSFVLCKFTSPVISLCSLHLLSITEDMENKFLRIYLQSFHKYQTIPS